MTSSSTAPKPDEAADSKSKHKQKRKQRGPIARFAIRVCRVVGFGYAALVGALLLMESRIVFPAAYMSDSDRAISDHPNIETVTYKSADGTELKGRLRERAGSSRTVIYYHGNGVKAVWLNTKLNHLSDELNATVLAAEYRGYMEDDVTPRSSDVIADSKAARDYMCERYNLRPDEIVLYGSSLGGGCAAAVAADGGAQALILERTFDRLTDVAASKYPFVPVRLLMRNQFDSIQNLQNYSGPLIQVHGEADHLIPIKNARRLFDSVPSKNKFWLAIPNLGHNDGLPFKATETISPGTHGSDFSDEFEHSMKKIFFDQFGEPADVLEVRDVPEPQPARGEVLVRMIASPINPSDLMSIRGIYGSRPQLPAAPGFEGVGIVESSGGGLFGKFLVGKRVAVLNRERGNWGEKSVVGAKQAIPIPDGISDEQAAMFFVNPATAWVMSHDVLKIPRGSWLLQSAAGSSLGRMLIRLSQHEGFQTINVVRRTAAVDALKAATGAQHVIAFDPATQTPAELSSQIAAVDPSLRHGVPFAVDPVGGATGSAIIECLGRNARMLCYGTLDTAPLQFSPRSLMTAASTVSGFWLSVHMSNLSLLKKLKLIKQVGRLIKEGVLTSEVGQEFSLDNVVAATQFAEQTGRGGKALLRISK